MKAVLIASNSQLKQVLTRQFRERGRVCEVVAPKELAAAGAERFRDGIVIEASTLESLQTGRAVEITPDDRLRLLDLCAGLGVPLILLSDGRVFDGSEAPLNHRESEAPHPASVAGGQLSALEAQLAARLERHVILRSGALFSEVGENCLTRIVAAIQAGERLTLSNSLKACPTHAADLARVVSAMVDQYSCDAQCWGAYHYNSSGYVTAFEFAEIVYAHLSQHADLAGAEPRLIADEAGAKLNPPVPVLRCDRILQHFGIKQLPWRSFLPGTLDTLCEEQIRE